MAGSLAVAGIALAGATSTVSFTFTPSNVPTNFFQAGQINIHTQTTYTAGTRTDRAQFYLDDDFRFNTNARPKCSAFLSSSFTMQQAMTSCGPSLVGTGTARIGSSGPPNVCVLAFNGSGAQGVGHIRLFARAFTSNCSNPSTNTTGSFSAHIPAYLSPNPANVPGTADDADFTDPDNCSAPVRIGCQPNVPNIAAAVNNFQVWDFNLTIGKPTVPSAGSFIGARCHDSNKRWNLQTRFTYVNPVSLQTVGAPPRICS